ncbi:hypothetical protein R50072_05350 [Simiduia litorea]
MYIGVVLVLLALGIHLYALKQLRERDFNKRDITNLLKIVSLPPGLGRQIHCEGAINLVYSA